MITLKEKRSFANYTVLIPSIAVGNVGQLALDLVIATLKMQRIGSGWHSGLLSIFGPSAYEHINDKSTSFEIYCDDERKLMAFQFRAPFVNSLLTDFHQKIVDFFKEQSIGQIIILCSSYAFEKHVVESSQFAYLTTEDFLTKEKTEIVKQQKWEEYKNETIHGGGNGKKLFDLCKENKLNAFLLFKYVSEGDNSQDATDMLGELNRLLKIFDGFYDKRGNIKLKIPVSWKLLYGNDPPELIF